MMAFYYLPPPPKKKVYTVNHKETNKLYVQSIDWWITDVLIDWWKDRSIHLLIDWSISFCLLIDPFIDPLIWWMDESLDR